MGPRVRPPHAIFPRTRRSPHPGKRSQVSRGAKWQTAPRHSSTHSTITASQAGDIQLRRNTRVRCMLQCMAYGRKMASSGLTPPCPRLAPSRQPALTQWTHFHPTYGPRSWPRSATATERCVRFLKDGTYREDGRDLPLVGRSITGGTLESPSRR